jgi:methionine-rich copper-binding protein CopC
VTDDVAPVTGTVANAGNTNDTTPTIAGTAEANATVALYNGATLLGATTADANGAWTFTPGSALAEGAYSVTAKATDAAGNQSAASAARTFTVDATAPATPAAALDLTAASDTGSSSTDDTTNDTTPGFAIGQLPADVSTVKLLVDGVEVAATYNAGTGEVTPNSPLADGARSITYQYVDPAGNVSASSPALSITIDATTPDAPSITSVTDDAAPVTGTVANDGRTNDTTPTIAGTAEANATVALYSGATLIGTTTADANGAWTFTPGSALAEGAYSVTAKATDAAGNQSAASTAQTFTVDTTAPAAPAITGVADNAAPGTGTVANAGSTNDTTPTIGGTAEANATVTLYNGSTLLGTTTADSSGNWAFTPASPLVDGTYSITATATDTTGNESTASAARTFTLDTAAPAAPVITNVTDNVRTPGFIADSAATDDATPTFSGTAEANATVNMYNGATLIGTTTADGQRFWSFTPGSALASASYSFTARASDAAGNVSADSAAKPFSVDAIAPTLASSSPVDNATTVAAGGNIVLTFSEAVVAGSGNITISNGTDTRTISIGDTTQVTISGSTVTINPTADLQPGSAYNVLIAATALKDLAGNPYAGIADNTALNFATISPAFRLQSLSGSSTEGFAILGYSLSDASGYSVSNAGDVNGDGLDDLIIGAYHAGYAPGKAYVVFGSSALAGPVHLSDVEAGSGGFVMYGSGTDQAGYSVSDAGDVNGDGLADLLVGTLNADPSAGRPDGGQSYIVYGKTSGSAIQLSSLTAGSSSAGFVINGASAMDGAGYAVSAAGDVNGDGLADIIVGAPRVGGGFGGGQSYVVFGSTASSNAPLEVSSIVAGNGSFVIDGSMTDGSTRGSGSSVSSAGDVNGDGLADLIIGANSADGMGRSYVVFGKTGSGAVALSAVATNSSGFVINGFTDGTGNTSSSGYSVSTVGDVNGDGLSDLIIGAPYANVLGRLNTGRSFVVFGKTDAQAVNLTAVAAGSGGFMVNGETSNTNTGYSVSGAGDVNGDGLGDMIIGAYQYSNTGRSYLVYGKSDATTIELSAVSAGNGGFAIDTDSSGGYAGYSVSAAGDVNGDGFADLLIGAPLQAADQGGAGRSYVIFGSSTGGFASASAVDVAGTTGDDTLSDSGTAKTIVAGTGNDTITATAASVVYAGAGDDRIVIDSAMITALQSNLGAGGNTGQLTRVDGGSGLDTLALAGSDLTLDLTAIANQAGGNTIGGSRIDSIERIDLTGTGNNTLTLAPADIRDMAGMNLFNAGNGWTALGATVNRHQMVVDGNAGDVLNASGTWNDAGTITVGGKTYAVYNDQASATQLLVDTSITRNINAIVDAAPTLSSSSPADNASGIAVGSNIVLTFSEAVAAGTGNIVISNGTDTRTISVTDTSQVTISGSTVTVNPTADLQAGSTYNVQMASGVIKDATGNNYAGISDTTTLNFSIPVPAVSAIQLSAIAAGSNGFVINGTSHLAGSALGDLSGFDIASVGDINGDGLSDLLVGAKLSGTYDGSDVYVVFGKCDSTAPIELSDVAAGNGGFLIHRDEAASFVTSYPALSLSTIGDLNGDGLQDILIGETAYKSGARGQGRTYVVYGKTDTGTVHLSSVSAGSGGFYLDGNSTTQDQAGAAVSSVGDFNGDGLEDLAIFASRDVGATYVVYGKTSAANVVLSGMASSDGLVITGNPRTDYLGSISSAGDVNGDGLADLLIGNPEFDTTLTNVGRSYVVFGRSGGGTIDANTLTVAGNTEGFVINGRTSSASSGYSVSAAGDVNGDGLADLLVGAYGDATGRAYVVFGKTGTSAIELSAIASTTAPSGGFVINGISATDATGKMVSSAGDMNGDGLGDLIVVAPAANAGAYKGLTYVVYGQTSTAAINLSAISATGGSYIGFSITGENNADYSGSAVSAAGDLNGDGFDDLIVGAYQADPHSVGNEGKTYVIFGGQQFMQTVDFIGTTGNDAQSGTSAGETFVAGAGNDTLTGNGGADVMFGGAGNDVFVLNADNISKLASGVSSGQLARIDGGNGLDTLQVTGGASLDLTAIANVGAGTPTGLSRIESIEKIDLATDTAANSLTLQANDVVDMAGMNLVNAGTAGWTSGTYTLQATEQSHQLIIDGDASDTLLLSRSETWTNSGTVDFGGNTYNVLKSQSSAAQLLVDADVVVRKPLGYTLATEALDGLTLSEASDGTAVTVLISETGAVAGNVLKLNWGGQTVSYALQAADITAGNVTITVPRATLRAETAVGTQETVAVGISLYASDATTLIQSTQPTTVAVDMRGASSIELSAIAAGVGGFAIDDRVGSVGALLKVSNAGDVNGDGLDDLLIGYPNDYVNYIAAGTGRTYVVFGKTDNTYIDLTQLSPQPSGVADALTKAGTGGFVINSVTSQEFNGISVSAAGDLNGDGLADLLVGASGADIGANVDAGAVYVVYGKTSTSPVTLTAIPGTAAQNLGFIIQGGTGNERLGLTVSSAGDVNGDGLDDLLVGGTLKSYVVFGQSGNATINVTSLATLSQGFAINNSAGLQNLNVSQAGDVNGDGLADLVLGFTGAASPSYVIFGKTSNTTVNLTSLATTANTNSGFVIDGVCSASGTNVSSAGDVNGDGLADLVIGAPAADTPIGASAGRSYVVFGKTSTSAINLSAIAATSGAAGGFVINGASALDGCGISVSAAGDVNGDGLADLLVGASLADPRGGNSGQSYVVYGKAETDAVQLSALNSGVNGFIINGECQGDQSGITVSAAGDVNGDGLADLIVGEKNTNSRSYVIFGGQQFMTAVDYVGTTSADTITGTASSETLIASGGNDTLTGNGGADVMYAGAGNDVLVLNADNIAKLSSGITDGKLARVDGGTGLDTLQVMGGASLDLTAIANVGGGTPDGFSRIESIEKIDLFSDTAANILTVRAKDVIDMSGMNLFNVDGNTATPDAFHQLMIKGDAGDTVNIGTGWTATAITYTDATDSNRTYKVYQDDATHTQLLIDEVIVNATNHVVI